MSLVCTGNRLSDSLQQAIKQSIQEGAAKQLEQLITTDAVSSQYINRKNFLHDAAWCGFPDCVQVLLSYGADVNLPQKRNGCTALHLANLCSNTQSNPKRTISLLIEAGANINSTGNVSKCGKTALHHAIEHQRLDSVKELANHSAFVSLKSVVLSIEIGNVEIVNMLLIAGGHCGKKRSPVHYWNSALQSCLSLKQKKPKTWYRSLFMLLTEATVCSPGTATTIFDQSVTAEEMELLQYDLHNTISRVLSSLACADHKELASYILLYLVRNGYHPDNDVMQQAYALHIDYIAEYLKSPVSLVQLCVRTVRTCLSHTGNVLYGLEKLGLPSRLRDLILFRSE